jgi:hypothetical protein
MDKSYHAPVTNSNRLSILISSKSNSSLGALVTENVSTVSAVMLGLRKGRSVKFT